MNQIEQLARHGLKVSSEEAGWLKRMSYDVERKLSEQPDATDKDIIECLNLTRVDLRGDEIGGEHLFNPKHEELPYHVFDAYIRGVVRWMNELGMLTEGCCDGHGKRVARILTLEPLTRIQKRYYKKRFRMIRIFEFDLVVEKSVFYILTNLDNMDYSTLRRVFFNSR